MKSVPFLTQAIFFVTLSTFASAEEGQPMIDENLSQWTAWTGVPHESVQVNWKGKDEGQPMGAGDHLGIFGVEIQEDGRCDLKITGKAPAALISKKSYSNYHLITEVRWGVSKWPPSLESPRDSGIIYHSHGRPGAFWKTWMSGLEFQVQECEFGGYFRIGDVTAETRMENPKIARPRFDPAGRWSLVASPKYCNRCHLDLEKKKDWNTIELYVAGNRAVHLVNGTVVNVIRRAQRKEADGSFGVLRSGKIQIQSSGSSITYRGLKIRNIEKIPEKFMRFFETPPAE